MLEYFSLFVVLIFGLLTSAEDIKYGKIRNKYILLAIIYAFAMNIIYLFTASDYFFSFLTNSFFALVAGFCLWSFNILTAGDAKLFFAYSLLLPLSVYNIGYINFFPSFTILINTFVPVFMFLFLKLMLITDFKEKIQILKRSFTVKAIVEMSVFLFGFTWIIQALLAFLQIQVNFVFQLALIFSILLIARKYLGKGFLKISITVGILRVIFDINTVTQLSFLIGFFPMVLLFLFLMGFVVNLGEFMFNQEVKVQNLKKGMTPTQGIIEKDKKYMKVSLSRTMFSKNENYIIDYSPSGLKEEDIKRLQELCKERKIEFDSITIQQTMPFALLLFIGVLITIFAQGNIIDYIKLLYFSI